MAAPLTQDQKAAIRCLVDAGVTSGREIGRRLGIGHVGAAKCRDEYLAERDAAESGEGVRSFDSDGNKATVECVVHASRGVVTEEDLVRVCKIDPTRWRIVRMRVKAYQTGMKLAEKEEGPSGSIRKISETPHVVQLHSVSAELERVLPKAADDGIEAAFARHAEKAPPYRPIAHRGGRTMLEFDLLDVHFGKLAWRAETGQDYDIRIAESIFAHAVEDLMAESAGIRPERIIVPFGNDYVHTDSGRNETTSGTVVDTDGRRAKIYEVALMAFVRAIERLRLVAPVDVVLVPGNHDRDTSLTMAWAIKAWFRNAAEVSVDVAPGPRKYRLYGKTLIGYEHGDNLTDAQTRDLPAVMMKEAPREWLAQAEFHEWHIGHRHSERRFTTKDIDTNIGVVTRWLHSLSATDAWHHTKKFIGGRRAAEVLRYDRDHGYRGNSLALARTG